MVTLGSQRLIQNAVERHPDLLLESLRRSGALRPQETIRWVSPDPADGFKECRDGVAFQRIGVSALTVPLKDFWPARGPVWDALGVTSVGRPVLVEAKAHIPESLSPATRASPDSLELIERSLLQTRKHFAPRSKSPWAGTFYQYANRLAFQYFLRKLNGIDSSLVFLYFTNATDMEGPETEEEWHGAIRLIHAALGLPPDISAFGVHEAFIDARALTATR